ncbi:MAG: TonB-dependent receptor, partial [Gammaproteobacteria bacterium]|nr:TonB-dependent receptor [Gammaproteobacteria bacterium]
MSIRSNLSAAIQAAIRAPGASQASPIAGRALVIAAGLMTAAVASATTAQSASTPLADASTSGAKVAAQAAPAKSAKDQKILLAAADVPAPAAAPAAPASEPTALNEVVVTGSRIANPSYTSDSPLVAVGAGQIQATGQVSLDSALAQMPQFSAAQGQTEVGDVQGSTGFQGGQSYSDLRGLGPQRTLVLLDGQRLVPTNPNGAVDLNTIPKALIEGVDVITGGASAVYGSDAMAGVVNFRLRQHFHGVQLSYQHGASTHGDGQENSFSILMGDNFADDKGNAVIDLEYNERGGITGAHRSFFSNIATMDRGVPRPPEAIFNAGEFGGSIPISAINTILAGYPGTTPLTGTGNYGGYLGLNGNGTLFTTRDPGNCVQNYQGGVGSVLGLHITPDCTTVKSYLGSYFAIQVPMRRYNLFSRVTYDVTDNIQAYGQINYMHSFAQDLQAASYIGPGKYFYIPQNSPFVTGNAALSSLIAAETNPTGGPIKIEDWLTALGPRIESFTYNDYQASGGLKGGIGSTDLAWNVYGSYGQTLFNDSQANNVNIPNIENILYGTANYQGANGQNCVGFAWNPFGATPMSAGCLAYASGTAQNVNTITEKNFEADLTGTLAHLSQGKLQFALGVDYRGESFNYQADPSLNPAFNVMPSTYPSDIISPSYDLISSTGGTQNVREVYGELQIPVLKDKPFAKDVGVDLGARHSQYDLFGGVNTFKADFHWKTTNALLFRGSYERAIRAPSLQELYNPIVQAQDSISVDPCEYNSPYRTGANAAQVAALCQAQGVPAAALSTFTYGVSSAPGIIQGNTNLRPETANTYSLGFVLTPKFDSPMARDLGVSVDYYHIKINDAIANVGLDAVLQRCYNFNGANPNYSVNNFYCQQIQRDSNGFISLGKEF